ncbi:EF-hand domain-containing protein [Pseudomonas sp. v388]|uniref:XopAW family type III secretion system calcium-binding effector n=1 Tax=Pseudomonas sp. v388 TaxID=2479849 RepID=UPI000F777213|nr:XopAW family type III secretion system calcium-binding effector [Pseudomonas sp. v388]RRV07183.1 EF-hand domain-containing protein [Pseudomonas sp. v388]
MISGISSSVSSYTGSSSATSGAVSNKFQEELLARLDTDGDGAISKDELSSALSSDSKDGVTVSLSQAFSDLDSDDDDSLDAQELAALTPPPPPPMQSATDLAESLLSSLDGDGDGAISSEELTTGLSNANSNASGTEVFDALDTNEDGTVSLEELTASLQPQQSEQSQTKPIAAQALSRMVAALSERYDTDGSKPLGKYLDTAA